MRYVVVEGMTDFVLVRGLKDRSEFERLLAERFPAVAAEIDDFERGLLHMEMSVFARATCAAIDAGLKDEVQAHFAFVDELLTNVDSDLENAIYVSYLEDVFMREPDPRYDEARAMLPPRLQTALKEVEDHWSSLEQNASRD